MIDIIFLLIFGVPLFYLAIDFWDDLAAKVVAYAARGIRRCRKSFYPLPYLMRRRHGQR